MQLTLFKFDSVGTFALPKKPSGQYWVTHKTNSGNLERVVSVEGEEDKWVLKSNRNAILLDKHGQRLRLQAVQPESFYTILLKKSDEKVLLYAEPNTIDRIHYEKLVIAQTDIVTIGRVESNTIAYNNSYVSSNHAEIRISDGNMKLVDLQSANGTFVNGLRIREKKLVPGDLIFIMGLKIIAGKGFLAINNPDGKVTYNESVLQKYIKRYDSFSEEDQFESTSEEKDLFDRSPRFKRDIKRAEIKIDPPPPLGNIEETPLMFLLGPSITMGMASMFTGLLTLQNVLRSGGDVRQALPTLMMSLSMLLGTILWPILTKRHEKKKRIEKEELRQEKYLAYLAQLRKEIEKESEFQSEILHENHVSFSEYANRILQRKRTLWERSIGQNDFLKVRLGLADLLLYADIKYPEKRFTMEEDSLMDELYSLAEEPKTLKQVPIVLNLLNEWVSGLIGDRRLVLDIAKKLIIELAALHSYDELKLVFIYSESEKAEWEFVKWLPHVWSNDKSLRMVATTANEVKELSAFLEKEIAQRKDLDNEEEENITPYYVIFALDKALGDKAEALKGLLKLKKSCGFALIALYNELKALPKECTFVVEINESSSKIYDRDDISGSYISFVPDSYGRTDLLELAVTLANTELDTASYSYSLPNMLTFLEMFGVGKIEHLNALTRWKENDPTRTLEAPVGVDTSGDLFKLDLHEKYHGPHGLIAGMTGSGKSEFIMTYILSLAVNYHPDEVAFILIDYKGGGMASAFSELPHLAGVITNLDGAAVKRSLVSIQSELKRRQSIFNEISKKINVSNIDIYKYQKLYREGSTNEPLQHLFIISDEFAELKTQQPDFMEQLISAARIGRSLGVHLILATQKPSGVVDDQIWSNSRFRVCLKVQEKSDSMDVIKRPDAAELSATGRFYVQVGYNELFELGQSAWSGAPYYPADRFEKEVDDSIIVIDNLGRTVKQVKTDKRKAIVANPPKQIDEINKYLAALAAEEHIQVKPLWLDPIPEVIYADQLRRKYNTVCGKKLNPLVGEIDDPANQRQLAMTVPFSEEGHAVIYGAAGAGKDLFLSTMIYSLMEEHTPEELNFYILDFSSETLRMFSRAPYVGDVLLSDDAEKINNLLKMLSQEIAYRKKLFFDFGGDYSSYVRSGGDKAPAIIVIIHNYSAFAELYEEKEDMISYLTREGVKYGIYFVLTALNANAIRYRILQNFKQLFVLQQNDPADYAGILGNIDGVFPSKYKGRGIARWGDETYEFQIAHISQGIESEFDYIRNYCAEKEREWSGRRPKRIPVLPDVVSSQYLMLESSYSGSGDIPIGIAKKSFNIVKLGFDDSFISLVLSQNNDNCSFLEGFSALLCGIDSNNTIVIDIEDAFLDESWLLQPHYYSSNSDIEGAIVNIFNTLVERNNTYKDARQEGKSEPSFQQIRVVVNSLTSLQERLSEDAGDKLNALLEKGDAKYGVNFIIAESANNLAAVSFENWFKKNVSLTEGIWVGNGISEQYHFRLSKMTNDLYEDIGEEFGYVIKKSKPTLIKLLSSATEDQGGYYG